MIQRREFLKAAGVSAAALGRAEALEAAPGGPAPSVPSDTKYPKLAIKTRYAPQRLAFAASAGYEGVIVDVNEHFDPDKLSDSGIDQVLATARDAGVRIISIESMVNHLAADPAQRRQIRERFVRCLELAHRLGCKFVGTFSGGLKGASVDEQAKALAEVLNEQYLPVCDRLDVGMGPENYPCDINFATVPEAWEKVFALVPNHRFGLEFDPSHLVRQYIDPIQTAWDFRDRILAVHAKDTEIIQPVLAKVGIHGNGWWRYRIPGQGLIDWPNFITVLLQAKFRGGVAVEHEDQFWDAPNADSGPDMAQERKDGFILAARFLRQYLPARLDA